jgi:hypothetical protein
MIDIDDVVEGPEPAFLGSATVVQLAAMVLTLGRELSVLAARVAELPGVSFCTDTKVVDVLWDGPSVVGVRDATAAWPERYAQVRDDVSLERFAMAASAAPDLGRLVSPGE